MTEYLFLEAMAADLVVLSRGSGIEDCDAKSKKVPKLQSGPIFGGRDTFQCATVSRPIRVGFSETHIRKPSTPHAALYAFSITPYLSYKHQPHISCR